MTGRTTARARSLERFSERFAGRPRELQQRPDVPGAHRRVEGVERSDPRVSRTAELGFPRTILFDMDDTIFDHSLTCRAALRGMRSTSPVLRRRSLTEIWREYLRLLDAVHPNVLAGRISVVRARQERFRRLADFCGGSISVREAQALSTRYRALYQARRRAVPGARRILERLHNRAVIAVVTNSQVQEQEKKLTYLGFRDLVDHLVVSEGVGVSKPDPRIFQIALDRAGTPAADAVMLGNSWESDVLGARAADVRAVWFNRFHAPNPEPGIVAEIDTLEDPVQVERVLSIPGHFPARRGTRSSVPR